MTTKSLRQRKPVSLTKSRWTAYAAAGVASAVTLSTAENAEADSFYSGVINLSLNATQATSGSSSNARFTPLQTAIGNATVALFQQFFHTNGNGHANFGAYGQVAGFTGNSLPYASKLGSGVVLSGLNFNTSSVFNTMAFHGGFTNSQWLAQGVGILGFRFISPAEGTLHYGWAKVNMTSGAPGNFMTLIEWAYSDQPLFKTGQIPVPEPGSLGLLAAGAAGLLLWRRSRAKAA